MVAEEAVHRGEVFLIDLNPARGTDLRKTRPCVIVSPDDLTAHVRTFIVAPLTTGGDPYPFRIPCRLAPQPLRQALTALQEMFAPCLERAGRAPRGVGSRSQPARRSTGGARTSPNGVGR